MTKTYPDNLILSDKSDLDFPDYKMVRADIQEMLKEEKYAFTYVPNNLNKCLLCEFTKSAKSAKRTKIVL